MTIVEDAAILAKRLVPLHHKQPSVSQYRNARLPSSSHTLETPHCWASVPRIDKGKSTSAFPRSFRVLHICGRRRDSSGKSLSQDKASEAQTSTSAIPRLSSRRPVPTRASTLPCRKIVRLSSLHRITVQTFSVQPLPVVKSLSARCVTGLWCAETLGALDSRLALRPFESRLRRSDSTSTSFG